VTNEASSFAGHQRLGRLIVLYDDNEISIDGETGLSFTENRAMRYEALGWHVIPTVDGHDTEAVAAAIDAARAETDRPSLLCVQTTIGFGSPSLAGKHDIHSDALGADEVAATKRALGIPTEPDFFVPDAAATLLRARAALGADAHADWQDRFDAYAEAHPDLAADLRRRIDGALPDGWEDALPTFAPDAKGMATRAASGKVLDALADILPELVGGSADLTPSNKTQAKGMTEMQPESPAGRYVHYGVREHGMGAILSGLALHGGIRPYGGTFLIFSDYMKPSVRLAALMRTNPVYVFTHDSIALGEDGPTHQPIEQLAGLRAIPNLHVLRPADANETAAAWAVALTSPDTPTALALSRQNVPTLDGTAEKARDGVARGAYVVADCDGTPDVILVASGSEVGLVLQARGLLGDLAVRVVSMPSDRLFFAQDDVYSESVLPSSVRARVTVEAGSPQGWHRVAGDMGVVIGLDRFGESAPWEESYAALGFTPEAVAEAARASVASASR
jgi:transketolase